MKFSVSLQNLPGVMQELSDVQFEMNEAIARTSNFIMQSTITRVKNKIHAGGRSGRIYKLASGRHQASAPGEAPANITGALARSYTFTKMTARDGSVATAGSPLKKAKTLELGGLTTASAGFGSRSIFIAPRPVLNPSFNEAVAAARTKLRSEFNR